MTTQESALANLINPVAIRRANKLTTLGYGRAALGGAIICAILALVYTFIFIIYALVRSLSMVTGTVNQDAGLVGTLIATWASLAVAALIIGMLLTLAVAILGAVTGVLVRGVCGFLNPEQTRWRASMLGACVCFILVVLLHLALRSALIFSFPDLLSMHALFWLELPSLIFVVAGGIASRRLVRS